MERVYLSLGSNMGDRGENIARAIEALDARGIHMTQRSSLYETEPVNVRGEGWFFNAVVEAETDLTPRELMDALLDIERSLGRERHGTSEGPKEPRTIDIDILLFGSKVVKEAGIEIPHPRMAERRFVLVPLAEVASVVVHPVHKRAIAELLAAVPDGSQVRRVTVNKKPNPPA